MYSSEYTSGFSGPAASIWPHFLRLVTNGNVGQAPRRQKDVPTKENTTIQKETFTTGITKMF